VCVDFSFVDVVGKGGKFGGEHFCNARKEDGWDGCGEEHFSFVFFAFGVSDTSVSVG